MMFLWILLPILLISLSSCGSSIQRRDRRPAETGEEDVEAGRKIQSRIFRLAKRIGGTLTVSDVVVEIGLPVRIAEQLLEDLTDGVRVRMDVGDDGIVRYVFTEFVQQEQVVRSRIEKGDDRGD